MVIEGNSGATYELRDDGTNGDRIAGDRIYTTLVPTGPILSALRPDDVHRVVVGFLLHATVLALTVS